MATTAALPTTLETKLADLTRHVRRVRLVRGTARLALVLTLTAGVAVALDALVGLPGWARGLLLVGWLYLAFRLALPLVRSGAEGVARDMLASAVESEYPNLNERLTSAVELSQNYEPYHGSPRLVAMLVADAETRTRRIDFQRAVPARPAVGLAATAGGVLVAILAAAAVVPTVAEHGRRFFLPFYTPPVDVPFRVVVNPGDTAVARGKPVTLAAHLEPTRPDAALPERATLVVTDSDGNTRRLLMASDQPHVFHLRLESVPADLRYRVESGAGTSDSFNVFAVDPIELAVGSPAVSVAPPDYAARTVEVQSIEGMIDFQALQHSVATFGPFRFNRGPQSAVLEWHPAVPPDAPVKPIPLAIDGATAPAVAATLTESGTFRLVMDAEHGIRTETPVQTVTVTADQPPAFVQVKGVSDQSLAVRPDETLPVALTVADDVGVAAAAIEYRINDGPTKSEPVDLQGKGTREASAQIGFKLVGKVKEGDTFQYRLVARDNRDVPAAKLGPQTVYYPSELRWATLRIARQADGLNEQQVKAQQEAIDKKLRELITDIEGERRGVYKAQMETTRQDALTETQKEKLRDLREEHQKTTKSLNELAREAGLTPDLGPLTDRLKDVGEKEFKATENDLASAEKEPKAQPRTDEFRDADRELGSAVKRLEEMRELNKKLAQERLTRDELNRLADREQDLAQKAANAKTPEEARQLEREQQQVAHELNKLANQSEPLRDALDAAKAQDLKELAEKARELAQQERELDQAARAADQEARKGQLADLAKKQQELAEKAAKLAEETKAAATAAQSNPLKPDDAREAAKALEKGDPFEALKDQEKAAAEMDRHANELEKALNLAKDPREAARQLARLQEDVRQRMDDAARNNKPLTPQQAKDLKAEQEAIRKAADQLSVPADNRIAEMDRKNATDKAAKAADALDRGNRPAADKAMADTKQALQDLVEHLPSLEKRAQQARGELAKLKAQQEAVGRTADQAMRQLDKKDPTTPEARRELARKLEDAARLQESLERQLKELDLPNQDARRQKAAEAMRQAREDLKEARPQDVAASQQAAKRELERLDQALAGQKSADEKAAELAKRQHELAEEVARTAENPFLKSKLRELQARQQQVANEAQALQAPEAPQRQAEAVEAARKSESALRENGKPEEMKQKAEDAARALDRLAEQMNGQESDAEKARRLAERQAESAADADKAARNEPNAGPVEARKRLQQVAEEAKQLRAGDAQKEKQQVQDALSKLQTSSKPEKQADAQKQAADAMKKLADRLADQQAKQPPSPAELARQQAELARQTQQAADRPKAEPGEAGKEAIRKAMEQAAGKQQELNRRADQLPADGKPGEQAQAAKEAMKQAAEAAANQDAAKAGEKQAEAARALEQMARPQNQDAGSPQVPNAGQARQARGLAKEQRELRDAVSRLANDQPAKSNPDAEKSAAELARQQEEVARKAEEMAKSVGQQQGQQSPAGQKSAQAAQAARQASKAMQNGSLEEAEQAGRQAAQQMEQLAQGEPNGAAGKEAAGLAKQQEEINRQLEPVAGDPSARQAMQQARQQELRQQAGNMAEEMNRIGRQLGSPQAQQARQAAQAGQQAREAMENAQRQARQGQQGQANLSRQAAADFLDSAARQAREAAQSAQQARPGQPSGQPAGESLQQAQRQMTQAQNQLGRGQPQNAQPAMQSAAQSLQQAAQQLGQPQQGQQGGNNPGSPNVGGAEAPDLASLLGPDGQKYAGKPWGELPGELKTRIIQDMKSKYGDDYARVIKLYFEQLADRK